MVKKRIKRKQTDIESILQEILEEEKLAFVREYKRGTYHVDFYIPDRMLSIQADGGYWHSYCSTCPNKKKPTSKQKYQALKDKACISFHKRFKASILRFCECELKSDKEFVRNLISQAVEEIDKGNLVYRNRNFKEEGKDGRSKQRREEKQ